MREFLDRSYKKIGYPLITSGQANCDREIAHERVLRYLKIIESFPIIQRVLKPFFYYQSPLLESEVFGIKFSNPFGIAADFDKNAYAFNTLSSLGFSFVEIGTVTPKPQPGQNKPRVFYSYKDSVLINRMGFPSEGMDAVYHRIFQKSVGKTTILGINIGVNKQTLEEGKAAQDLIKGIEKFSKIAHYLTINLSSPNTPGLKNLQNKEFLSCLFDQISINRLLANGDKKIPILLKISPDLGKPQIDEILTIALGKIDGLVVANTTTNQDIRKNLHGLFKHQEGGMSGKALTKLNLELSHYINRATQGKLPIIRSGGVMDAQDTLETITYGGADLIQFYTALVGNKTTSLFFSYNLSYQISQLLLERGVKNIQEMKGITATLQ